MTATAPSIAAVPLPTATAYVTSTFLTPPTGTATGATGSAAIPFTTPDGLARTVRVPILMYHYVSQPGPDADIYRKDLSVPPDRFESHLAYLRDNGFHVISLDDLRGAMVQGKKLPDKPVVLTFDDGYEDNYTNAFPLLKKYGMTAYFFILTDVTTEGRAGYMSWAEIEEMSKAGQHIGAHGRNHQQAFRGKTRDFLVWHALGTSEAIQQHLGYHPRWVAYPSGAYDDLTMEVFHSAGFVGGLSTEPGATHRPDTLFHLSRVRVHGNYSAEELGRLLNYN